MRKLPSLPDPGSIFSAIDKAGSAIETGLNVIDKVADKFEQVAQRLGPPSTTHKSSHETPPAQKKPSTASGSKSSSSGSEGVSREQVTAYQQREIGKLLLRMETHYAQKLRINGIPCDCGAQKHLLDMESLCEETIPMVDDPKIYHRILDWIKKVGPKSTDKASKSGHYGEEYARFSHEARDFRKEVVGSIDSQTLFPEKPKRIKIPPVVAKKEIQ